MVKVIKFMLGIFHHNFKKWILLIRHCSAWTVHHSAVLDTDNPIPLKRDAILGHLVGGEEHEGRPVPLPRGNSTVRVGTLSMRAAMDTTLSHLVLISVYTLRSTLSTDTFQ